MSTVNANVNSGKTFTPDAQGQALLTLDDLNRLGIPTVTVELSNSVAEADIKDGAVTVDKLGALAVTEGKIGPLAVTEGKIGALAVTEGKIGALAVTEGKIGAMAVTGGKIGAAAVSDTKLSDTVADAILTAAAVVSAENTNVVAVTIAVKDIQGNALSGIQVGIEWWISDVPASVVSATGPTAAAANPGIIVTYHTNYLHGLALTNTSGQLALTFFVTGNLTRYFCMLVQGRYVGGNQAMVWSA